MSFFAAAVKISLVTAVEPSPSGTVREAVRADLLDILRIEQSVFDHPWKLEWFESFLGRSGFLVVDEPSPGDGVGGDVAGYVIGVVVERNRSSFGHIKNIAVKPDRQGTGRGRTLLERSLTVLASQGADTVRLEVRPSNERAIDLYRRYGFGLERTKPDYYPDGEEAFQLARPLRDRDRFYDPPHG